MSTIQSIISRAVVANIRKSSEDLQFSILNLASGIRHNTNVADFSVGTVLQNQSATLNIANINAGNAKSLLQTAQGALDEIMELVQSIKDLAVQAADSSLTDNERANLNIEAQDLIEEINRLATTTNFNNKNLIDGSASGTANLSSTTGQATENYSLLNLTDFSFSGTTAAGELDATSGETFAVVASGDTGKTYATATIALTHVNGVTALTQNVVFKVGGVSVSFGNGVTTTAGLGTALVAALEASTSSVVRQFTYKDNGNGTISVTSADLGDYANSVTFELDTNDSGNVSAATLSGDNINGIDTESISSSVGGGSVLGTDRAPTSETFDANLEGGFSNFTATLDTSGTQNQVTFTVDVNGTTYTSDVINLFGTGGFGANTKGAIIKNGQVITFRDTSGPTDSNGEYTDNVFTLKIDDALGATDDITISGADQDAFELDLTNTAAGFLTQLANNRINQSRDVILPEVNATGSNHDIAAAVGTTFAGIEGFDAVGGNNKGDILFVGDQFGDEGLIGAIGNFSFNSATDSLSVTINGEVYTADISDNTANTGGIVDGAGSYNSSTKLLTVGAGTTIVFHSASTDDGRQLRLDLSNLTDTNIELNTADAITAVTDDLDTLFGVGDRPSLSFQVGNGSDNSIGVSLASAKTTDIFLNDAGTSKTINISTEAGATAAQEILDNALNSLLSQIATTRSNITTFNSAIVTNNVMIQNYDAASSNLLNTDYALESTLYAENTLKINAAVSVLAQEQTRLNGLLTLLGG